MADFFSHYGKYDGGTDGSPNTYSVLKINSIVAPLSAAIVDLNQFKIDTNSGKYLDRRYFTKAELGTARLARVHWENIIRKPDLTPAGLSLNHNHDQRYYTRSEVDNKLNFQINQTIQSTLTSNYVSVDVLEQTIIGAKTFNDLRFGDENFPSFLNSTYCNIVVPSTFSDDIQAGTLITVPKLHLNEILPKDSNTVSIGTSGLTIFDTIKVVSEVPIYANNIHTGIISITGNVSSNLTVIGDISATGNISSQGNLLAASITGSSLNINGPATITGVVNANSGIVGDLTGIASSAISASNTSNVNGFTFPVSLGYVGGILTSNGTTGYVLTENTNNITDWNSATLEMSASTLSGTYGGVVDPPDFSSSGPVYKYNWRRVGNCIEIQLSYGHDTAISANNGAYLLKIPNGGYTSGHFQIDGSVCNLAGSSPDFPSGARPYYDNFPAGSRGYKKVCNIVGRSLLRYDLFADVLAYDPLHLIFGHQGAHHAFWGSTNYGMPANTTWSMIATVPIVDNL